MSLTRISFVSFAAAVLAHGAAFAAETPIDYADTLGRVYAFHNVRILATKEVCETVAPDTRKVNDKAYAIWRSRHITLLRDLERRYIAMIRRNSKDEKDYAKNYGKYEGVIHQERQEYKEILLGLGAEMKQQCQQWPSFLNSPDADYNKVFAAELATINKHK